jgi:hypothetical protein
MVAITKWHCAFITVSLTVLNDYTNDGFHHNIWEFGVIVTKF